MVLQTFFKEKLNNYVYTSLPQATVITQNSITISTATNYNYGNISNTLLYSRILGNVKQYNT